MVVIRFDSNRKVWKRVPLLEQHKRAVSCGVQGNERSARLAQVSTSRVLSKAIEQSY